MRCMFYECPSLNSINLSSFNTSNVTEMRCMSSWCSSLKKKNIIFSGKDKQLNEAIKNLK